MLRKILCLLFLYFLFCLDAIAQYSDSLYPVVGKYCPPFDIHDIEDFKLTHASLSDFGGKWLILDFWNIYCSSCVSSFPNVNKEVREFQKNVNILLIGIQDSEGKIQGKYKKFKKSENLQIPFTFDSSLAQRFNVYSAPYIVVIDPSGVVRGITCQLSSQDIADFVNGGNPRLSPAYRINQKTNTNNLNFNENYKLNLFSDSNYLYESRVFLYNDSLITKIERDIFYPGQMKFEAFGAKPLDLFRYAYLGKIKWDFGDAMYARYSNRVLIRKEGKMVDASMDLSNSDLYCYSLKLPITKRNKILFMSTMQNDLSNYFGYKAVFELRYMECWKLIVVNRDKVFRKSRHQTVYYKRINEDKYVQNFSIDELMRQLCLKYQNGYPFINCTNLFGRIDLVFDQGWLNFKDIKQALRESGLDLIKSAKKMHVLILKNGGKGSYTKLN